MQALKGQEKTVFNERISLERGIAEKESMIKFIGELLKEAQILEATVQNKAQFKLLRTENLQDILQNSKTANLWHG